MRVPRWSIACVALIAMVWCTATVSAQTAPPSAQTAPSAQTTPPSAQLLTPEEVGRIVGGQWTGTCGHFGVAESPSIGCTISRGGPGDGLRSLTLQMDPIPVGMSVAATRAAWRLLVDPQVTPGVQTLRALPNLGDEAYLVTGSGAYASEAMLMFFAGGNSGMLQASIDVVPDSGASARPDPAISDQLVRLAQIALPRFEAQLGAAVSVPTAAPSPTASNRAIIEPVATDVPATSAGPVLTAAPVASTAPGPTAAPEPVTPVAPPAPPGPSGGEPLVAAGPADISLDPVVIATTAAAAAGIVLLIPFPAALFNSTVEENYAEIRGWFRFRRRRPRSDGEDDAAIQSGEPEAVTTDGSVVETEAVGPAPTGKAEQTIDGFWATRLGIVSFFLIAGLLYGFLDRTFGLSLDSALLYVGIVMALAVSSLVAVSAVRSNRKRLNGERGSFRVLPATLIIALVCVLLTRITDFQPGYLYGVLAGLAFIAAIPARATGREQAITASAVAGAGVVAFIALGLVRTLEGTTGATGLWRPIDVALSALVIGGFEALLFGMLPLSGLPGATVKAWDARIWALLLFLGAAGFLHIIVNPSSGYLVDSSRVPLAKTLVLLVGFGFVSVGLWAWFRFRPLDHWRAQRPMQAEPAESQEPSQPPGGEGTPPGH